MDDKKTCKKCIIKRTIMKLIESFKALYHMLVAAIKAKFK